MMWSKRYFQFSILCAKEERAQHHHFYKAYPAYSGDLLLSYLQHTYICSHSHTSTNILHSCLICVPVLMYLTVSLRMRMIFGTSYLYLEGHTTDRLVEPFGSCKTVLPCRPPPPKSFSKQPLLGLQEFSCIPHACSIYMFLCHEQDLAPLCGSNTTEWKQNPPLRGKKTRNCENLDKFTYFTRSIYWWCQSPRIYMS